MMSVLATFDSRLHRKYVLYFASLVGAVLIAGGASDLYSSYQKALESTLALQAEKAAAAAIRIEQFISQIEQHIGWTNLLPRRPSSVNLRQIEFIKLLRQAPAVTDAVWIDAAGREQLRVSRLAMDRLHSGKDFSLTPAFQQARSQTIYRGPVYFRDGTEPYMTLATAAGSGISLVEVNLKFVWDVINSIQFGATGHAYVIDSDGQLISHPDISLVLKRTDMSELPQVARARHALGGMQLDARPVGDSRNLDRHSVIATDAPIPSLGWAVVVEQESKEAFAPLYASMARTGILVLLGSLLALGVSTILAGRMVRPIRALQTGAARLGAGNLDQKIEVHTGDELESLAEEFNHMGARLRDSYASLEQKVAERTEELVAANRAKSRFLAAASHDLRQPMHALGLFVTQLKNRIKEPENRHLTGRIEASVSALQGLLDALLDVSRLDAGAISVNLSNFPLARLLDRIDTAFAPEATERNLHFRVKQCQLSVQSDPILLERILINLVANALRYTERGGILVGCRKRSNRTRIEVWDTGIGIPVDHQDTIFQEFFQIGNIERDRAKGLGLGLSIAARLARLLGGRIELRSVPGRGSVFALEVPLAPMATMDWPDSRITPVRNDLKGTTVLIIDDDALVREAIAGLLEQWGCITVATGNGDEALAAMASLPNVPDLVLCDYRLPKGETGDIVINRLREKAGPTLPAALITGDTALDKIRETQFSDIPLLHKPVQPARLRTLLQHLLSGNVIDSSAPIDRTSNQAG